MGRSGTLIIIPALNEERSLHCIIDDAKLYGTVLVVNDGSMDHTAEIAATHGAIVLSHTRNLGYDASLTTGFRWAATQNYLKIVTMDADGQHQFEDVEKIIAALDQYDLVWGDRDRQCRWSEKVFSVIFRLGWGIHDPLCGLKGYRSEVLNAAINRSYLNTMGIGLALQSLRMGFRWTQVQIRVKQRLDGESRLGGSLSANLRILGALFKVLISQCQRSVKTRQ